VTVKCQSFRLCRTTHWNATRSLSFACAPELEQEPGQFPILDVLEFKLPIENDVDFGVEGGMPPPLEGITRPSAHTGRTEILVSETVYEGLRTGDGRARFTGSHELFHALVHVPQLKRAVDHGLFTGLHREGSIPAYRSPEWQANGFASRLLMPTEAVKLAVKAFGHRNVDRLARLFGVSRAAMSVRLRQLGLAA